MDDKSNINSAPIPVHRVAVVRPFTWFLTDIGAPVERHFRQAGLPWCALENVNNFVPSHRFWKFLITMAHSEGILDLGFHVGDNFGADCADPRMTELITSAPTLYQGLLNASELINRTITHCRVGILQPPNCGYAYFYHQPSCEADNPAIEQIGWFGLTVLLDMVHVYSGPQWQPAEIGLMTNHMPCRSIRERFPNTRVKLSQAASYIALDNAMLSLSPLRDRAAATESASFDYDPLPDDFVSSLEQVLMSYIQESDLNLEIVAGLCNTSRRTLQRKLKASETCYRDVLDHARFSVATRLLSKPDIKITDIARHLGYSEVSHFARTFRRIAGVGPKVYRDAL